MRVIATEKLPIKLWLNEIEDEALAQAKNLANLPFAFRHIALMPDSHVGYGMPIGGVLATREVIIPNAVGVDIGCGMMAVKTSLTGIDEPTLKAIMGEIRKAVPVGFNHHKEPRPWEGFDRAPDIKIIQDELKSARCQLGTLGGGNHFIEIQKGDDGYIWVMLHSGSRNFGLKVAKVYHERAKELCERWFPHKDLSFLPMDSPDGQDYFKAMNFCLDFAQANRSEMMARISRIVFEQTASFFDTPINIHHNYAVMEHHCASCIDNLGNDNPIVESLSGVGEISKAQGFLSGYRPVPHSCGGLILKGGDSFLKISPLQADALGRMNDALRSLNLVPGLKYSQENSSLHFCECEDLAPSDESCYNSLSKFGLGFSRLFGVEKDCRKWDRILGRIFLGFSAYDLDCKVGHFHTSSISQKHSPTQVMVHRKGAVRAYAGQAGIIPGSMGTASYITEGLGNDESFKSSSHGAGRRMGRKDATRTLNLEDEQVKMAGIIHGLRNNADLDEAPGAYKDIEDVMANQSDLVKILVKLRPLAGIKG
jgi:RNA-splicing ligase RtcB